MKTEIKSISTRRIWDSRGRPTVEVDVVLSGGAFGRAAAPAGASRGLYEAVDLRDGGSRFGGMGVERALGNVRGEIARVLIGADAADQEGIDDRLSELDGTPNFSRLGGNACVAVSLAVAHAAAAAAGLPLWQYLARGRPVRMPVPEIQIFGGGAHAGRRIDIQDLMIVVPGADSLSEAFEVAAEVYRAAGRVMSDAGRLQGTADEGGWWPNFQSNEEALEMLTRSIEAAGKEPGKDVFISLDIAASEFCRDGRYELALDNSELDTDEMIERVAAWSRRFAILSIEDPVSQEDSDGMVRVTDLLGARIQIVGDDFLVTDAERIRDAHKSGACNTALIKVNQAGSVTKAMRALDAAIAAGWSAIVSARSGETEDVSIAHLAVGWNAGQIKVGSFARSERMAKWNELLRIEEALGPRANYAGWTVFPKAAASGPKS
jgi:enolase